MVGDALVVGVETQPSWAVQSVPGPAVPHHCGEEQRTCGILLLMLAAARVSQANRCHLEEKLTSGVNMTQKTPLSSFIHSYLCQKKGFEVFMAVTIKNALFGDVATCGIIIT
jgi:hypothetical protein